MPPLVEMLNGPKDEAPDLVLLLLLGAGALFVRQIYKQQYIELKLLLKLEYGKRYKCK